MPESNGIPKPDRNIPAQPRQSTYTFVPDGPLGHDPNATREDMLRARSIPVRDQLKDLPRATPPPPEPEPIKISKEDVLVLCRAYGIDVISENPTSGRRQNLEERVEVLKTENATLLDRARLAEESAASAIRELRELKASASGDE